MLETVGFIFLSSLIGKQLVLSAWKQWLWPTNTDSVFQHDSSFWKLKYAGGSRRWVDYSKARKSLLFVLGI